MPRRTHPSDELRDVRALAALAVAKLVFHLATSGGWGFFRDELYYLACTERMAWGYVDQPPLSIGLLWTVRRLFGDTLPAIRLISALSGAATVFVAGLIARDLGARRPAQLLAGLCTFFAPVFLVMGHYYSMNGLDVLCWAVLALLALRILLRDEQRLWLWFGVVAGLGLENKYSVAFFAAGLAGGLLLTRERRHLASPWLWAGGAVAALLIAPHLWWQVRNDFPSLEFMATAAAQKNVHVGPLEFLLGQITLVHPLAAPVWLAGLGALLLRPAWSALRPLGIAYVIVFAIFVLQGGKVYYLAPIYPLLFGAGAAAIDAACAARGWTRPMPAAAAVIVIFGLAAVPTAFPIMPVQAQRAYLNAIGLRAPRTERHRQGVLPQHLADYFGWQELVATVARTTERLGPADRNRAVVMTRNYGEAGAVEVLGAAHELPRAISGHNNYWLWGPGDLRHDDVVIAVGFSSETLSELFESVELVDAVRCTYCMPYQNDVPIHLARGLKLPLAQMWRRVKRFV